MRVLQQTLAIGHGGDGRDEAQAVERVAIAVHLAAQRIDLRSPRVDDTLDTIHRALEVAELRVALDAFVAPMQRAKQEAAPTAWQLIVRRTRRVVRRTILAARSCMYRRDTTLHVARAETRRRYDQHATQLDADDIDARVVARRRCRHHTRHLVGVVSSIARLRCSFLHCSNEQIKYIYIYITIDWDK
jgi:hypothetical protein